MLTSVGMRLRGFMTDDDVIVLKRSQIPSRERNSVRNESQFLRPLFPMQPRGHDRGPNGKALNIARIYGGLAWQSIRKRTAHASTPSKRLFGHVLPAFVACSPQLQPRSEPGRDAAGCRLGPWAATLSKDIDRFAHRFGRNTTADAPRRPMQVGFGDTSSSTGCDIRTPCTKRTSCRFLRRWPEIAK